MAEKLGFKVQEASHDDIRQRLFSLLREKYTNTDNGPGAEVPMPDVWLREVFDKYFIYEEGAELYKQAYSLDADDQVAFSGDPVKVRLETRYLPVGNSTDNASAVVTVTEGKENVQEESVQEEPTKETASEEETIAPETNEETEVKPNKEEVVINMERKEKVDAIIKNGTFEEDNREFLMGLEDAVFEKIYKAASQEETPAVEEAAAAEEVATQDDVQEEPAAPVTAEKYLEDAPEEIRQVLNEGLKLQRKMKADLVKGILANENNAFTKEQLDKKDLDELRALAKLAAVKTERDFTGNAGGVSPVEPKVNERGEDGSGVSDMPKIKWNQGKPDFSELQK